MPKWLTAAFACCLTLTLFTAQAQTVDEVIAKYVEAIGGKEKLSSIKSVYMEGVAVMQNGSEITTKVTKVDKQLMRTETSFGMGSFTFLVTDKQGWFSNPRNGGKFEAIPEDRVKMAQSELDCAGPLVDYAAKGHKAELIGKEAVDGVEYYKVKLTLNSGNDITYFIDPSTYYIMHETRKGGGMMGGGGRRPGGGQGDQEMRIDYSDYRKTDDGYVFAYSVTRGGMGGSMTYEKIEVNKPVDPKMYKPE
ncbi:hypothetical protein KJS94_09760 [Flavihumibacter rivuli]|uniref:hypothetical protein n=1 Tax=Flavihumibacter rivuli TaxID=2838156 RepID=UPI001BDF67AC|nr:hypothetical protein [Flavihumibacter rivuli]ULQ54923.1 hypothetical protein KJS94_09760 [Flavihumibacter rivuli]